MSEPSNTSYAPLVGTVAHRALQVLQGLPPGTELSSTRLLEELGQPSNWTGLVACLEACVIGGLIVKRLEGRPAFWKLPSVASPYVVSPIQKHEPEAPSVREARPKASQKSQPIKDESQPVSLDVAVLDSSSEFDCALSKSGRLSLSQGLKSMVLSPEDTKDLLSYLDRLRGDA